MSPLQPVSPTSVCSYRGFSVFEGLNGVVGLFHVKRLLHEVVSLALVPATANWSWIKGQINSYWTRQGHLHPLLLQDPHGLLFDHVLMEVAQRSMFSQQNAHRIMFAVLPLMVRLASSSAAPCTWPARRPVWRFSYPQTLNEHPPVQRQGVFSIFQSFKSLTENKTQRGISLFFRG